MFYSNSTLIFESSSRDTTVARYRYVTPFLFGVATFIPFPYYGNDTDKIWEENGGGHTE